MSSSNLFFSDPMMSWKNIKQVSKNLKTCPTQCIQLFSEVFTAWYRKRVQMLGIFKQKAGFSNIVLLNHSRMVALLTLNHCMILHFVVI